MTQTTYRHSKREEREDSEEVVVNEPTVVHRELVFSRFTFSCMMWDASYRRMTQYPVDSGSCLLSVMEEAHSRGRSA